MPKTHLSLAVFATGLLLIAGGAAQPTTRAVRSVRVAALAGLNDFDFWPQLSARFEQKTGIHVDTVVSGNKDAAPDVFRHGGIDLITMQSSEPLVALAAEGYAGEVQPWVQTDLAIVGPVADPAGIKGMTDAAAAIKKIIAGKSLLVVHGSLGADQVVKTILLANKGTIDPARLTVLLDDHQKHVLQAAMDAHAYTLISRVAFGSGKLPSDGYAVLVQGDPVLFRPFVAAVANPAKLAGTHDDEAHALARFLLDPETQDWIREFGKGKVGDGPLFRAVVPPRGATTRP